MESAFWSSSSFDRCENVPRNWEEIVETANRMIVEYCEEYDPDFAGEYSEFLWEQFCARGSIGGVFAVY